MTVLLWLLVIVAVVLVVRWVFTRWMTSTLGVRPTPGRLGRVQEFMTVMQRADQLVTSGETGQALLVLTELAQRQEVRDLPVLEAQIHLNSARIAHTLQRYDAAVAYGGRAVEFYRRAYQRFRSGGNASGLGEALQIVARAHLAKEEFPLAKEAFQEIRAVNRRGAFRQTVVRTEIELARLHIYTDDYDQAVTHAREARALAGKWRMADHVVEAIDLQALSVALAGDLAECHRLLDEAVTRLRPDAPLEVRAHYLSVRAAVAAEEGDIHTQVAVGGELLTAHAAMRAGRGGRADQSQAVSLFVDVEQRTLAAAYKLAEQGDAQAAAVYVSSIGLLRESEIASLLRSGLLVGGAEVRSGLSADVADLFAQLARVENPDTPVTGSPAALYERLETVVSGRFRQLVQAPARYRERVVPRHHYVQLRLIEDTSGVLTLFGCWEQPDGPALLFSDTLPSDAHASLLAVTGAVDDRTAPVAEAVSNVRASVRGWSRSRQFRALSGQDDGWRCLAASLLPPELLDLLRAVPSNAADDAVPLIVFSPDNLLWSLPWAALTIDDGGTLLGDRAAVALLPSSSLLRAEPAPRTVGSRVLSFLHGVHAAGLSLERSALDAAWPTHVDEVTDASTLVDALADTSGYALLTMSVHGDDRPGLAHSLRLDPQRRIKLSAARMMSLTFPRTVVVGACFSGSLDKRVGTDPVGIPSVMLCRGASTVVGGLFPLPDGPGTGHATATVLSHFYALHAQGVRSPWALRRAQQRWRAEHDTTPYTWAGLTVMTNCDLD